VTGTAAIFGLLSRALSPPAGEPGAFASLGVERAPGAAIAEEHAALFGRAGRAVVSPYEGAHTGADLHAVLATYAENGLLPHGSFRDRPDHVSMELAAMEELCREATAAQARGNHAEARRAAGRARGFFARRLAPWLPGFLGGVARARGFAHHAALAARVRRVLFRATAGAALARETAPPAHERRCTSCGGPLGFTVPSGWSFSPAWGYVCAGCRLRADLRRHKS